ncbi:hypothetical protein Q669_05465 [Labrenzia sp. C1B10]|nr:hypothetical protein Q669_05465 [Labrenzia sp. C1B10]ERS04847.1 hypothetical protein Q675_00445 [Labrenzia sp. C1B70]
MAHALAAIFVEGKGNFFHIRFRIVCMEAITGS